MVQGFLGAVMTDAEHTPQAFEAFVLPHLRTLLRLARRLVREEAEAEDLVQETCLKAFRAFHQFCPGSNGKAWLVTILLNTVRDRIRQASHTPQLLSFDEIAAFVRLRNPRASPRRGGHTDQSGTCGAPGH